MNKKHISLEYNIQFDSQPVRLIPMYLYELFVSATHEYIALFERDEGVQRRPLVVQEVRERARLRLAQLARARVQRAARVLQPELLSYGMDIEQIKLRCCCSR